MWRRDQRSQRSKSTLLNEKETPASAWAPAWAQDDHGPLGLYKTYYKESYKSFTQRDVKKMRESRAMRNINIENLQQRGRLGRAKQRKQLTGVDLEKLGEESDDPNEVE